MDDLFRLFAKAWPYLVTSAPGVWLLYLRWSEGKRVRATDEISLIKIAEEVSRNAIKNLREETDDLRQRLEEVEQELRELQRRHTDMIADKDAKITLLEGEKRQLEARLAACVRLLAANNIAVPMLNDAYWLDTTGPLVPAQEQRVEKAT